MEKKNRNTVILKWNPAISSYPMQGFLTELWRANLGHKDDFNWSVWDYDKVHEGDIFFWLKVGYGQVGIVGQGIVTSEPYQGEDWSGKGRKTFYIDFEPQVLINPDAFQLLDADTLTEAIPDFDWTGGHSGLVLTQEQAKTLGELWRSYLEAHKEEFIKAKEREDGGDRVFIAPRN